MSPCVRKRASPPCCIDYLMEQPLTPLQRQLALFGMKGGPTRRLRRRIRHQRGGLKKHSAAIVSVLGLERWADLTPLAEQTAQHT